MSMPSIGRPVGLCRCPLAMLLGALLLPAAPVLAAEPQSTPPAHEHGASPMPDQMEENSLEAGPQSPMSEAPMNMSSMQGGSAPPDARDANAYADGYEYTGMPGFEKTDQIAVSKVLLDEFEFVTGNEGKGAAWSAQITHGGDNDKLWLRSQGLKISGQQVDSNTDVEALWWHAYSPFWGRTLGVRQDIGPGAHTWLALGIEGLAPYWFDVELTGYVGEDGRLAARAKASYDMLFTNRLIMTPQIESNLYSKSEGSRGVGSGVSNVELGVRLRYEVQRKIAPYIGYVWERSIGNTADLKRAEDDAVSEGRFVAGIRLWW